MSSDRLTYLVLVKYEHKIWMYSSNLFSLYDNLEIICLCEILRVDFLVCGILSCSRFVPIFLVCQDPLVDFHDASSGLSWSTGAGRSTRATVDGGPRPTRRSPRRVPPLGIWTSVHSLNFKTHNLFKLSWLVLRLNLGVLL